MINNSLKSNSYIIVRLAVFCFCFTLTACSNKTAPLPKLAATDIILAFGDSLTFGTGANESESYPAVLASIINRKVVRAGVPGETSAEGLQRLPATLDEHQPKLMILCLGGNDFLRKLGEQQTENNLREMVKLARARGIAVVLLGVPRPALFGGAAELYHNMARDFNLPIENDVLSDVLHKNDLKSDAVHPNAKGYRMIAEALAQILKKSTAIP